MNGSFITTVSHTHSFEPLFFVLTYKRFSDAMKIWLHQSDQIKAQIVLLDTHFRIEHSILKNSTCQLKMLVKNPMWWRIFENQPIRTRIGMLGLIDSLITNPNSDFQNSRWQIQFGWRFFEIQNHFCSITNDGFIMAGLLKNKPIYTKFGTYKKWCKSLGFQKFAIILAFVCLPPQFFTQVH